MALKLADQNEATTQLAKNARLSAASLQVPTALRLHASHASPMALHAAIEQAIAKGEWTHVGEVLVK